MRNKTVNRVLIQELSMPVDGYTHSVQIITSVDGGETFWYGGNGKFVRGEKEARALAAEMSKTQAVA